MNDPEAKQRLLKVADEYGHIAEMAEQWVKKKSLPVTPEEGG